MNLNICLTIFILISMNLLRLINKLKQSFKQLMKSVGIKQPNSTQDCSLNYCFVDSVYQSNKNLCFRPQNHLKPMRSESSKATYLSVINLWLLSIFSLSVEISPNCFSKPAQLDHNFVHPVVQNITFDLNVMEIWRADDT